MKVLQVNLAGIHRYMDSICWYVKCRRIRFLRNQGGNADYIRPFSEEVLERDFFILFLSMPQEEYKF